MNLRKAQVVAITTGILFTQVPAVWAASFADVDDKFPHFNAIEYVKEKEIVEGYKQKEGQPLFKPNQPIIRAEALKMILESAEVPIDDVKAIAKYSDVDVKQWFYPYVMKASEIEVVKGYTDGTFKPAQDLALVEALKILLEAHEIDTKSFAGETPAFKDVPKDAWYAQYVNYAQSKNIVIGRLDGNLEPMRKITRGQLAEIIYRLHSVTADNFQPFDVSSNWPKFEHPRDNFAVKKPSDWAAQQYEDTTVFWKEDRQGNERFFAQQSDSSSYLAVFQDENEQGLSQAQYFDQLKKLEVPDGTKKGEGKLGNLPYFQQIFPDGTRTKWYFYLPNQQVLVAFIHLNSDSASYRENAVIEAMINSIEFVDKPRVSAVNSDDVMSVVRENILVEGKGKEMLQLLKDTKIIHTDTIGVGTGPVDYYFSATYGVTLKHERAADLLLDVKKGEATDF